MPITLNKPKTKIISAPKPKGLSLLAEHIDNLGKLEAQMAAVQAVIDKKVKKELEQLKALAGDLSALKKEVAPAIDQLLEDKDADKEHVELGEAFKLIAGKKGNTRTISDMVKVATLLNDVNNGLFLQLAKVNLTDLDKYLTPDQKEQVIKTDRGPRTFKVEKRADV